MKDGKDNKSSYREDNTYSYQVAFVQGINSVNDVWPKPVNKADHQANQDGKIHVP